MTDGSRDVTPVANSSSPCLLAIDVDDDAGTSSLLTYTETSSDSFPTPISDAQPSLFPNNDDPLRATTSTPESSNVSMHLSTHDPLPADENQINPPDINPNTFTDDFGITYDLPKIDSPPFAAMMAAYQFNNDVKDSLNPSSSKRPAHTSIPASKPAFRSSAPALDITTSTNSWFPSLPHATVPTPAPSESNAEDTLGMRWFESSGSDGFDVQQPTEVSDPGQYSLRGSVVSNTQPITAYQSDRLDAIARVEDTMTREEKAMSVGQGIIKRGGRSWLAHHATRSDTEHGNKWGG